MLCSSVSVAIVAALAIYVSNSHIHAVLYVVPPLPALTPNSALAGPKVRHIGEKELVGPESLARLGDNFVFTGLADGRIVRVSQEEGEFSWATVLRTGEEHAKCGQGGAGDTTQTEAICGRPLGLRVVKARSVVGSAAANTEDALLVVDPYKGLLLVRGILPGQNATAVTLATECNGEPFRLINDVVQRDDGTIYLTETSRTFERRRIFHAVVEGRKEGRVYALRPMPQRQDGTGMKCEVLAEGMHMANGITLNHDGTKLMVVAGVMLLEVATKGGPWRVLKPTDTGALPGTGDNVRTFSHTPRGDKQSCYWMGLGSKYALPFSLIAKAAPFPLLRRIIGCLIPYFLLVELIPKYGMFGVVGENGAMLETFQDPTGATPWISEVEELGDYLILGSWYNSFLSVVRKDEL